MPTGVQRNEQSPLTIEAKLAQHRLVAYLEQNGILVRTYVVNGPTWYGNHVAARPFKGEIAHERRAAPTGDSENP